LGFGVIGLVGEQRSPQGCGRGKQRGVDDTRDGIGIPAAGATYEELAAGAEAEVGLDAIQAKVTLRRRRTLELEALAATFTERWYRSLAYRTCPQGVLA
jgi:hypothetical protein